MHGQLCNLLVLVVVTKIDVPCFSCFKTEDHAELSGNPTLERLSGY